MPTFFVIKRDRNERSFLKVNLKEYHVTISIVTSSQPGDLYDKRLWTKTERQFDLTNYKDKQEYIAILSNSEETTKKIYDLALMETHRNRLMAVKQKENLPLSAIEVYRKIKAFLKRK